MYKEGASPRVAASERPTTVSTAQPKERCPATPPSSLAAAALEHRLAKGRGKEVELRSEQVCDLLAVAVGHARHALRTQRPLLAVCRR